MPGALQFDNKCHPMIVRDHHKIRAAAVHTGEFAEFGAAEKLAVADLWADTRVWPPNPGHHTVQKRQQTPFAFIEQGSLFERGT